MIKHASFILAASLFASCAFAHDDHADLFGVTVTTYTENATGVDLQFESVTNPNSTVEAAPNPLKVDKIAKYVVESAVPGLVELEYSYSSEDGKKCNFSTGIRLTGNYAMAMSTGAVPADCSVKTDPVGDRTAIVTHFKMQ